MQSFFSAHSSLSTYSLRARYNRHAYVTLARFVTGCTAWLAFNRCPPSRRSRYPNYLPLSTGCYVACQVSISSLKTISVPLPFISRFQRCRSVSQSLVAQSLAVISLVLLWSCYMFSLRSVSIRLPSEVLHCRSTS
jgi:hypothetical protein